MEEMIDEAIKVLCEDIVDNGERDAENICALAELIKARAQMSSASRMFASGGICRL